MAPERATPKGEGRSIFGEQRLATAVRSSVIPDTESPEPSSKRGRDLHAHCHGPRPAL